MSSSEDEDVNWCPGVVKFNERSISDKETVLGAPILAGEFPLTWRLQNI
jgi:hypothetical protein